MYQVHQDAVKLPVYVESEDLKGIPAISASASMDGENRIHVSLTNADPVKEQAVNIELRGWNPGTAARLRGRILTSEKMQDHNSFENPGMVTLKDFSGFSVSRGALAAELPPKSLVTLELA
jgi:alpha-N-arabinofuranosidase